MWCIDCIRITIETSGSRQPSGSLATQRGEMLVQGRGRGRALIRSAVTTYKGDSLCLDHAYERFKAR